MSIPTLHKYPETDKMTSIATECKYPYIPPLEPITDFQHDTNRFDDEISDCESGFMPVYSGLLEVLSCKNRNFPQIDIKDAERCGNLTKLKSLPMMCTIVDLFRKNGLEAQIGYNMSSCEISLTVSVKVMLRVGLFGQFLRLCL